MNPPAWHAPLRVLPLALLLGSSAAPARAAPCDGYAPDLAAMVQADQSLRGRLDGATEVSRPLGNALDAIDRENTARLKRWLARCGWPLAQRDGAAASAQAWLLVQHADRDRAFQHAVLPLLERAVRQGEARGGDLAYLDDRLAVAEGRPQRYGTQFTGIDHCRLTLAPIDSREAVDARRRAIPGMPSLAEYERAAAAQILPPACRGDAPAP